MQLFENQLFDGRYLLIELIGRGASAEVWKATDTKAGDMVVAVKIYKPDTLGPGSAGIAEFQREFTMVYNMTHTNLLHPQGFDISEGSPYLVMAFCENGSATSMVGRCDEGDILHFLRDVAAGLEYLHDHNIIHQDIKPDNVLVDDNCNFMVTDFGISSRESADDTIGGTRAYMAPEVYKGKPEHASDIWSLGATAVELVSGQPPYGELGGAAQLQNSAPVVINARLSAPVKKLIGDMLDPDPRKRPSAAAVRSKIDHFRETGSWNRNVQRNKIAYIATGIVSLLLCVGLFFWDINRTKIRFYKDYTEIWGVPKGIGEVSPLGQTHRAYTYRMEYKGGKLRHLTTVNPMGYITIPGDTELQSKLVEAYFFYTNDGNIDYVKVYNQDGECIYVMDYDGNLKTIILKSDDEYGTEKPLRGKTSETSNATNGMAAETNPITRYKVNYDDKGRFSKIEYATFQNVDVTDGDMIHGMVFEYDGNNRMTKKTSIGLDGQPRGNQRGLAVKEYAYDDDDNWVSIKYLTVDGSPSSDGSGAARVDYTHDEYGNPMSERYLDLDGNPMIYFSNGSSMKFSGVNYERGDNGLKTVETYVSADGKPTYLPMGYMKKRFEYDLKGHLMKQSFLDEHDRLVNANMDGSLYAITVLKTNERGSIYDIAYFDSESKPTEDNEGIHRYALTLDSVGHPIENRYLDKEGKPALCKGYYSTVRQEYDNLGRLLATSFFDVDDKPVLDENGVSIYRDEIDRSGKIMKRSFFGTDGQPVLHNDRYASIQFEYDQRGNEISERLFNTDGTPINCMAGWQYCKMNYDPATNFLSSVYRYDTNGVQVSGEENKHDDRGNITEQKHLGTAGQLQADTAVEHAEYDRDNRVVRHWYTGLNGNKTNKPDDRYHEARYKYDVNGNTTEFTFWSASGEPVMSVSNVHKIVKEYDDRNQMIHWLNLDTHGNAIVTSDANPPEARFEYDARGNQTLVTVFDGNGLPHNSVKGWQKQVSTYDDHNNCVEVKFFDKDGSPVKDKDSGYSRIVNTFDVHGNCVKEEYYDGSKLILVNSYKFNRRAKITEQVTRDGDGNVPQGYFPKLTLEYEADDLIPRKLTAYDINGNVTAWMFWDKQKGEWGQPHFSGN